MSRIWDRWGKFAHRWKVTLAIGLALGLAVLGVFVTQEVNTSSWQAQFFSRWASESTFSVGAGPSTSIRFPQPAPYDDRLGYSSIPALVDKLKANSFDIAQQSRMSAGMVDLMERGYFAPYSEKLGGGLSIVDAHRSPLFAEHYPQRIFHTFKTIAPALVQSLLYIENRELLNDEQPKRNPAVEWGRLAQAVLSKLKNGLTGEDDAPGGSTLATQIEKYRHSPDGRTSSMQDKWRQMISASLRAYQPGEDTTLARRQIVVNYMNTMPLSAKVGFGEVHGMGDGLWAWYARDFAEVTRIFQDMAAKKGNVAEQALLYKQALSLLISQRRPSYYLESGAAELEELTNSHLRLLASVEVISPQLRDAALPIKLKQRMGRVPNNAMSFVSQKAANTVRNHLSGLLGGTRLYDLDRLDLGVFSTLDAPVQEAVTSLLRELQTPEQIKTHGLAAPKLLAKGDPSKVVYSFTLYERGPKANYLRVQTDNFDQPLNINEDTKLDLGSTAKLRTLVTYLDIIDKLHQRLATLDKSGLQTLEVDPKDTLTRWAVDYLSKAEDKSLSQMLNSALERTYSANPSEGFMTGGGLHYFGNFSKDDNSRVLSVRDGLRNSVNLVSIRLMRDIVHHYMFLTPGSSASLLQDRGDPRRAAYLARFADREGQVFIRRYLAQYQGKSKEEAETLLLQHVRPIASRLAAVFRTIEPNAPLGQFTDWINANLPDDKEAASPRLEKLYAQYATDAMNLADRAYVSGLHPLELWLVGYLRTHPNATQKEIMQASVQERQAVYQWLFASHRKQAQDKRILGLLEVEGFLEIHAQWARMGYPFGSLVPSYATALGASADRPSALAEMMGILVNEGVRKPNTRIESLHFAHATPYETVMQYKAGDGQKILSPEVAKAALDAVRGVVQNGTAQRVKQAFVRPDGSFVSVGGKTGTGDQRFDTYGAGGRLTSSRVVNRSATFVFNIDERFFGTLIAYVPGAQAAGYDFTSGLPVQLLKILAPTLMPLVNEHLTAAAATATATPKPKTTATAPATAKTTTPTLAKTAPPPPAVAASH